MFFSRRREAEHTRWASLSLLYYFNYIGWSITSMPTIFSVKVIDDKLVSLVFERQGP